MLLRSHNHLPFVVSSYYRFQHIYSHNFKQKSPISNPYSNSPAPTPKAFAIRWRRPRLGFLRPLMIFWTVERGRLFSRQKPLTLQPCSCSFADSLIPICGSATAGGVRFILISIFISNLGHSPYAAARCYVVTRKNNLFIEKAPLRQ